MSLDEKDSVPLVGYFKWKRESVSGFIFDRLFLGKICLGTIYKYGNKYYSYVKTDKGDSEHKCCGEFFKDAETSVYSSLDLEDKRDDGK